MSALFEGAPPYDGRKDSAYDARYKSVFAAGIEAAAKLCDAEAALLASYGTRTDNAKAGVAQRLAVAIRALKPEGP